MGNPQHFECDTPDCCHWQDGDCTRESSITIQEHHCVDYEERIRLSPGTVTIYVQGGNVLNVYASPDLPSLSVQLLDMDNAEQESDKALRRAQRMLNATAAAHHQIY